MRIEAIHTARGLKILPHPGAMEAVDEQGCLELTSAYLADNLVVGFEHLNERAHPFIALRSRLLKHVRETGQRVFATTSLQPGNGKTHIAVNLAAALSRVTPTVLIELDLRRPSVGARLNLPVDRPGIDDYLEGSAGWDEVAMRIHGFDLTVHRVRDPRDHAEELLAAPRLSQAIADIVGLPDRPICIVDTPPVMVDDDFTLISRVIDGVLMVVEEGCTSKRALTDAMRTINPTPIIGSVLNKSISSAAPTVDYGYYRIGARRPEPRSGGLRLPFVR